ncbi:hypothetical protein VPHK359_0086 [Vibrio phage K359]
MTITRDVLVDIMRTPALKDKHAGFVGFEDIHNWTWCYDKSRLGGCNNVYSMQEVQRLYALGIPTETPEEKEVLDSIESGGEAEWKNGDECVYKHQPDVTYMFVGMHPVNKKSAICWNEKEGIAQIHIDFISKPETPQQREDRERACAIYDMCAEADIFTEESNFWAGKFYDLGYKKEKTNGAN